MAVRIRLKRMGSKRRPFYRIIATDSRNARDGRFIETLGYYDPMKDPADINVKEDLIFKWMKRGAQPTESTEQILRDVGVMKKWALLKKGVSPEELDAKYDELKSKETPPMDAAERERKAAEKMAAAKAEVAETPEEAPADAESAAEPKAEAAAEPAPESDEGSGSEEKAEAPAEATAEAEAEAKTEVKAEDKAEPEAPEATEDDAKKES